MPKPYLPAKFLWLPGSRCQLQLEPRKREPALSSFESVSLADES